ECGALSETCVQHPGDTAPACHIDCSIAGQSACPPEYSCSDVSVSSSTRKLCVPAVPSCLDALGGFCDRMPAARACTRASAAGTCDGERTCDAPSERFTACDANAPQLRPDCATASQPACTE